MSHDCQSLSKPCQRMSIPLTEPRAFTTPSPTGVATTLQVRSEEAPERIALQFTFTEGQRLELVVERR